MSEEYIDIVNEDNQVIGQATRSEAHKKGLLHRMIHVWIYTPEGKILIQQRAAKMMRANVWDVSVGGHIDAGEDSTFTAVREVGEELGLAIVANNLELIMMKPFAEKTLSTEDNQIGYIYSACLDITLSDVTLQEEEVADVGLFTIAEIQEKRINEPELFDRKNYWDEMFVELEKRINFKK